jgi:hypothetical protein
MGGFDGRIKMDTGLTRRGFFGVGGGGALLGGSAVLAGTQLVAMPQAVAVSRDEPRTFAIGNVHLQRVHIDENLLPDREHAGFGSLLYDSDGKIVLHDGDKTWLYTTGLFEAPTGGDRDWYGKWISHVREFNTRTLVSGEKKIVLGLASGDQWAVIHNVVKVSDSLYVAFYSTNVGVRAAVSHRPDGMFEAVPDFQVTVTDSWEEEGGEEDSLESNGGHVKIEESDTDLSLWLIYDSYHVDKTSGFLGWAKIRIDKQARGVELTGKHPSNPLAVLPKKNYIAARAGGNLPTDLRLDGKHVLFYYTRRNRNKMMLTAALSSDPLFQDVTDVVEFEPPLGTEEVIEKFEAYMLDDVLHIIYENRLESGHWGTGIRLYEFVE